MARAILFDWTDTLMQFTWDDELLAEGHRVALGRDDPEFTERYRDLVFASVGRPYEELLRELGVDDPDAFVDAEHEVWRSAHQVLSAAQALLDSLRGNGYKTGLVANTWPDPPRVIRRDIVDAGLADLLDVIVLSTEVGARKPDPRIFLAATDALGVDPIDTVFVGDRLETDVQGAANVGMTTIQALWFNADDSTVGVEPDFMAFTPMDVLNAVRRLAL